MNDAKGFAKGAMLGIAAGAVMTTVGKMMMNNKRHHFHNYNEPLTTPQVKKYLL